MMSRRLQHCLLLASLAISIQATGAGLAPAFELPAIDANRSNVKLSSYSGQVVYLDFWSVWCAPCREALPEVQRLEHAFADQAFAVVTINLDHVAADARRFLTDIGAEFPVAMDPGRLIADKYGVDSLPFSVLLDQEGRIRSIYRAADYGNKRMLEADIRTLLAEQRQARADRSAGSSILARWGLAD